MTIQSPFCHSEPFGGRARHLPCRANSALLSCHSEGAQATEESTPRQTKTRSALRHVQDETSAAASSSEALRVVDIEFLLLIFFVRRVIRHLNQVRQLRRQHNQP